MLLWWRDQPIGICVFASPPKCLAMRNRFFGRSGRWERISMRTLNSQLLILSRVVLHPTFRGAGVASLFIRRACQLTGYPWIETLTQMGQINPVFERAGFLRVGVASQQPRSRAGHSKIYGSRNHHGEKEKQLISQETFNKSRYASPVYFIFDNRTHACSSPRS